MNNALGSSTIRQESIDEKIDINQVNNLFLSNIDIFKKLVRESEDKYATELLDKIIDKGIDFPINKHMELFIIKNKGNIKKIIRYIIFRYKFFVAGKKK